MKNIEKYPNTKDALEAYNQHKSNGSKLPTRCAPRATADARFLKWRNIAMPLTSKDFKIERCTCPVCGRPAAVYSRDGHNYLRCMWEDCKLNANMVPISAERFFEFVEKMESRYVEER